MGKARKDKEVEDDPWALIDPKERGKPWSEKNLPEKCKSALIVLIAILFLLGFLYLFICSLDFLSSAFRLLGGKTAGDAFQQNDILTNPIAGLMLGVLATVLVQSSSTTTSIVVAMVGAGIMPIRPAIFVVMGANIGTSVTNTIVSLGQAVDRDEFRKAFAGATVHDMFNWLAVLILLPVEWLSGSFGKWKGCGLLCQITGAIVQHIDQGDYETQDLLKVITKPFTSKVIQIDKKALTKFAIANDTTGVKLMKYCYEDVDVPFVDNDGNGSYYLNYTTEEESAECGYWFEGVRDKWSEAEIGVAVLMFALFILIVCLICIVKILHFILQGKIALIVKKFLNSDLPCGKCGEFITGYLAILVGAGLTMLVQSSSIFTSAITPLVGAGVLHIDRMFPLTLGANIGTTITAILAALAGSGDFKDSMQIALCHLFFNLIAIAIWYPIPFVRVIPINMAKALGKKTSNYRWFAFCYLFFTFFIFPAAIFGLSLAGWEYVLGIGGPIFVFFLVIIIINASQRKCPGCLVPKCRSWEWCPAPLHSLRPYDKVCTICWVCCKDKEEEDIEAVNNNGVVVNENKKNDSLNFEDNMGYETEKF